MKHSEAWSRNSSLDNAHSQLGVWEGLSLKKVICFPTRVQELKQFALDSKKNFSHRTSCQVIISQWRVFYIHDVMIFVVQSLDIYSAITEQMVLHSTSWKLKDRKFHKIPLKYIVKQLNFTAMINLKLSNQQLRVRYNKNFMSQNIVQKTWTSTKLVIVYTTWKMR